MDQQATTHHRPPLDAPQTLPAGSNGYAIYVNRSRDYLREPEGAMPPIATFATEAAALAHLAERGFVDSTDASHRDTAYVVWAPVAL